MALKHRLGVNPLPWVLVNDHFEVNEATLSAAMSELGPIGFTGLHADLPEGWPGSQYRDLLARFGFEAAPGYFSAAFEDRPQHAQIREAARIHAGGLAAVGLTETFVAGDLTPARIEAPAIGAQADDDRLKVIAEGLAISAEAAASEGVRQALHPHISSWIETEPEVRWVLDATAGSALGFGPDVGHLKWAGADFVSLINDYSDRVLAVHLKDVDLTAAAAAKRAGASFFSAALEHHVWIEPGRGTLDFTEVFAALGDDFAGWSVVEVDVPNLPTPAASSADAYAYLTSQPFFTEEVA